MGGLMMRLLFALGSLIAIVAFLWVYRRRFNAVLAIVLVVYIVTAGSRVLSAPDNETLLPWLAATIGLGALWVALWYIARRWPNRWSPDGD